MPRLALIGVPLRGHYRRLISHLAELGYSVVTVNTAPAEIFASITEASLTVASFREDPVKETIAEYHRHYPLDGIALFHELTVEVSSHVAAALGLPHFPLERIGGCTDKFQMRRWMAGMGVRCPPFTGVSTLGQAQAACREIGYPVVIKPVRGGASYGVTRLDDDQDLNRFFESIHIFWEPRDFIVERYLPGHEISVETITDAGGRHTHLVVFDKPQALDGPFFLEEAYITGGMLSAEQISAACSTVSDMIRKLGLERCITHTELRLTPEGPAVLEFGLRPIGWPGPLCVEAAVGVDMIAAMAAIACGKGLDLTLAETPIVAGWRYLIIGRAGVVRGLPPLEGIRQRDGVIDASAWVNLGDRVGVPPDDFNYIKGYLAAKGTTVDAVMRILHSEDWQLATA